VTRGTPHKKGSILGKATTATIITTTTRETLVVKVESLFDGYLMTDRAGWAALEGWVIKSGT